MCYLSSPQKYIEFRVYDKVCETEKHFSLFCTFFAILYIFRCEEAFGSIKKLTVFAFLHRFDTEKTNQRNSNASKSFQNSFGLYAVPM